MATTLESFGDGQIPAAADNLFTAGAGEKRFIGNMTVTNTSASRVEVYLWRTADTPVTGSGGNWIIRETIPANKTVKMGKLIGHVLAAGESIKGQAATASVVNWDASGTLETG